MIFRNIRPVEVNNGQWAAILNFVDLKFFKMHPLPKPYNLFYSNGVAILSGFHDIPQNISVRCHKLGQSAGDCNRPSTFRDLLRKQSVRQNV